MARAAYLLSCLLLSGSGVVAGDDYYADFLDSETPSTERIDRLKTISSYVTSAQADRIGGNPRLLTGLGGPNSETFSWRLMQRGDKISKSAVVAVESGGSDGRQWVGRCRGAAGKVNATQTGNEYFRFGDTVFVMSWFI